MLVACICCPRACAQMPLFAPLFATLAVACPRSDCAIVVRRARQADKEKIAFVKRDKEVTPECCVVCVANDGLSLATAAC